MTPHEQLIDKQGDLIQKLYEKISILEKQLQAVQYQKDLLMNALEEIARLTFNDKAPS